MRAVEIRPGMTIKWGRMPTRTVAEVRAIGNGLRLVFTDGTADIMGYSKKVELVR